MGQFKLTPAKVVKIKTAIFINKKKKYSIKDLAEKYSISPMQVTRIARGECWKSILPDLKRKKYEIKKTPVETIRNIITDLKTKTFLQKDIAKKYNLTEGVISRIKLNYITRRRKLK